MEERKFKIGDRVICISHVDDYDGNEYIYPGVVGTVCSLGSIGGDERVGVCFANDINGHSCNDSCADKHGWYIHENSLSLYEEEEIESYDSDLNLFMDYIMNKKIGE